MRTPDRTLPAISKRRVQGAVVHAHPSTVADVLTQPHVMEIPCRNGCPAIGEGLTTCEGSTQVVVTIVPITEVAPECHVEDTTGTGLSEQLGCTNAIGAIVGEHTGLGGL